MSAQSGSRGRLRAAVWVREAESNAVSCAAALSLVGPFSIQCRMVDGRPIEPFREGAWMTNCEASVFLKDSDIKQEPLARGGAIEDVA